MKYLFLGLVGAIAATVLLITGSLFVVCSLIILSDMFIRLFMVTL